MEPMFKKPRETADQKRQRKLAEARERKRKPTGRALEKAQAKRREQQVIREVRAKVWERSKGCCEFCGDTERVTATKSHISRHQMNEIVSRAKTRGLPPEQRFNTRNCARNCKPCHDAFHAGLVVIVFQYHVGVNYGMDGSYQVRVDRLGSHGAREMGNARHVFRVPA